MKIFLIPLENITKDEQFVNTTIDMFNKCNLQVILLLINRLPENSTELKVAALRNLLMEETQIKLNFFAKKIINQNTEIKEFNIKTVIAFGNKLDVIKEYSQKYNVDIIALKNKKPSWINKILSVQHSKDFEQKFASTVVTISS